MAKAVKKTTATEPKLVAANAAVFKTIGSAKAAQNAAEAESDKSYKTCASSLVALYTDKGACAKVADADMNEYLRKGLVEAGVANADTQVSEWKAILLCARTHSFAEIEASIDNVRAEVSGRNENKVALGKRHAMILDMSRALTAKSVDGAKADTSVATVYGLKGIKPMGSNSEIVPNDIVCTRGKLSYRTVSPSVDALGLIKKLQDKLNKAPYNMRLNLVDSLRSAVIAQVGPLPPTVEPALLRIDVPADQSVLNGAGAPMSLPIEQVQAQADSHQRQIDDLNKRLVALQTAHA